MERTGADITGNVNAFSTIMRGPVKLEVGCILNFPFNIEVSAGEPSDWKGVHNKYHDQNCIVTRITLIPCGKRGSDDVAVKLTVRFNDGFEASATIGAFIYVGPPVKK